MSRRTVVITGASRGLGRSLALAFCEAGDQVIGLYASDEAAAASLRAEFEARPSEGSQVWRHDVRVEDPEFWEKDEIREAQHLVLVNNAWTEFNPKPFHQLSWEEFTAGIEVGVRGAFLSARALLRPMMRRGQGTIVNVLTRATHGLPPKGFAAYVTAKHALRGLTLALASEYSHKGIRVLSVSPGYMATRLTAGWDPRWVEAVRSGQGSDGPESVARQIVEVVGSVNTRGGGEDYEV